jgi:hypothetical protein
VKEPLAAFVSSRVFVPSAQVRRVTPEGSDAATSNSTPSVPLEVTEYQPLAPEHRTRRR